MIKKDLKELTGGLKKKTGRYVFLAAIFFFVAGILNMSQVLPTTATDSCPSLLPGKVVGWGIIGSKFQPRMQVEMFAYWRFLPEGKLEIRDNEKNKTIKTVKIESVKTNIKTKLSEELLKGEITGKAKVNGKGPYDFTAKIIDNGNPPDNGEDTFEIIIPAIDYSNIGDLVSGDLNIINIDTISDVSDFCSTPTPTPTYIPTPTPTPIATPTPAPTVTPAPTPTFAPTPAPTPIPTVTPAPTPASTPAPAPFIFPSCENLISTPGDKAHYSAGWHQIVGGSLLEGKDDVYSLDQNNYVQCFCPAEGYRGIQSDWLRTDQTVEGWFFVNGAVWDIGNVNYAVRNLNFSCQVTPTPTPTPVLTPTPTPTPVVIVGGGGCAGSCGTVLIAPEPRISVTKTANPSVLPTAGGLVTYDYEVYNPGSGFLTEVGVTDDKCSPVIFKGGDANSDAKLDRGEIWKYACQSNINQTTVNTATATGKFGIRVLTAQATSMVVVFGADLSIKVIKKATPELISATSGQVVYTYEVTNPGTLILEDVTLTDNKCSPINFISGDINSNSKLEAGENWKYACQAFLTATTTNTATARGQSGGRYVTDVSIATVLVGKESRPGIVIPKKLPKTGGGGAAADLGWSWLMAPFLALGLAINYKKAFKIFL